MSRKEKRPIDLINRKILKKTWKEFLWKFLISGAMRISLLVIPVLYSDAIDFATKGIFDRAYYLILISIVVTILYYLIEWINQYLFYNLYSKLYERYTEVASDCTFKNSVYSLSRFSLGEYANILNNDVDVMAGFYANGVMRVVQMLEFVYIYAYFLSLDIYIFLITVVISLIMLFMLLQRGKRTQVLNSNRKTSLDSKTAIIHETFGGVKEIKGFHFFHKIDERVKEGSKKYLKDHAKYNIQYESAKFFILNILSIVRLGLIFYGIYLVSKGKMEIGIVLIIYSYFQKIIDNFSVISTISVETRNLKVSCNRFNKLLEFVHYHDKDYLPSKEYNGKIRFENVLYGNRNDPILNNVSFEIEPNSITAITGKVGSGKTGIFDLLVRLNDKHSGDIYIDDDNIEQIHPDLYYNLVCVARKNPVFFDISIQENLMLVEDNFDEIVEICKLLHIHDDIERLSDGYRTNINSSVDNISNELKCMLAIARLLIRNSKIMMFDETISILDSDHQKIVLELLEKLKNDHTILLISRENSLIQCADYIIVFDKNKIAEIGTHKQLLKQKGVYYKLFEIQD